MAKASLTSAQLLALVQANPDLMAALKSQLNGDGGVQIKRAMTADGKKLPGVTVIGNGKPRFLTLAEAEAVAANIDGIRKMLSND